MVLKDSHLKFNLFVFLILTFPILLNSCSQETNTADTEKSRDIESPNPVQQAKVENILDFETGSYKNAHILPCAEMNEPCDCGEGISIKVVSKSDGHPVRKGDYSSYHRLANCHERSEVLIDNPRTVGQDKEVWVGWSIFIPEDFRLEDDDRGTHISQFHDRAGQNNCPGTSRGGPTLLSFSHQTGYLELVMRYGDGACNKRKVFDELIHIDNMRGRWTDFVVNAYFTSDPTQGFFKLWGYAAGSTHGEPLVDYRGSTYPKIENGGPNFRAGMYRGNPGFVAGDPIVLYVDEIKTALGVRFEDVAP